MAIVSSPNGVTSQDVFVGGVVGFNDLANPSNTAFGRLTGNLGLYTQEAAAADAVVAGTMGSIALGMANTGPGEAELNFEPASLAEGWFDVYWHTLFSNFGLAPAEINVVIGYNYTPYEAELSLSDFVNYVNVARRFGATSIAPIFSPNGLGIPLTNFATDPYYAFIRAAAIYGGGLTLDIPPHYFFSNSAAYQNFAYQEVQWAQQNNIRSTVIISPNGDDAFFLQDTAALIATLSANKAIPSEWVVENYNPDDPNGVGNEQTTNSIANAALYTAMWAPTSRPTGSMTVGSLPVSIAAPMLGAGVTVTDTVHTSNVAGPVYVAVIDAAGGVESYSAQPTTLDSNGNATVSAHLAASGDYIRVNDSLTSPNFIAYSNAVNIAEPAAAITITPPGTIQEASPGAGVTFREIIAATNVAAGHVDIEVITSTGAVESGWQVVPLSAGVAFVNVFLAKSGDFVRATDSQTSPTTTTNGRPVTITDPLQTITVSAPGAFQEASPGAGVSVVETITASNITGHVDLEVLTPSGSVESGWQVIPLTNGTATPVVYFAQSGDQVYVANSETAPTASVTSSPITITDPVPSITVSDPGTVQEASPGAGVNVVETIGSANITGHVDLEVLTAAGTVESGWQVIPLVNGTATTTVYFAQTGDYIHIANSETAPTASVDSSPVTITDASNARSGAKVNSPAPISRNARPTPLATPDTSQDAGPGVGPTEAARINTTDTSERVGHSATQSTVIADGRAAMVYDPTVPAADAQSVSFAVPKSDAGVLSISSAIWSDNSIIVTGLDQAGSPATMREFLDGHYVGVVTPTLQQGHFTSVLKDVSPGAHQLALTIDGNAKAALYDFTRVVGSSEPGLTTIVAAHSGVSTGSALSLFSQLPEVHALVWPTP